VQQSTGGTVNSQTAAESIKSLIVARAAEDPAFRQRLFEDPRTAAEEALGVQLPPEVSIQVVAETPTSITVVLPQAPLEELSDQQMEGVSGGMSFFSVVDELRRMALYAERKRGGDGGSCGGGGGSDDLYERRK